jgi:rhodanese-related sulfurtransferase
VADNLQKMGYTEVWSLDGGWKGLAQRDEIVKTVSP